MKTLFRQSNFLELTIAYLDRWPKYHHGHPNQFYEAYTIDVLLQGRYLQYTSTTILRAQVL